MSLTDYLPDIGSIGDLVSAPFKSRDGHPWLQSTARNIGHASFGDKVGNYVDQRFLGDPAPGTMAPTQQAPQINNQSSQAMQALIQQWLQGQQ